MHYEVEGAIQEGVVLQDDESALFYRKRYPTKDVAIKVAKMQGSNAVRVLRVENVADTQVCTVVWEKSRIEWHSQ